MIQMHNFNCYVDLDAPFSSMWSYAQQTVSAMLDLFQKSVQIKILSKFADRISRKIAILESNKIVECIEENINITKQTIMLLQSFQDGVYYSYSAMKLRTLVGLSPCYEQDDKAIRSLDGSVSWVSKKKVDATKLIRDLRDNE